MIYFLTLETLFDFLEEVTYQNEHNMLLNFPRYLSILLLQIRKTDNNVLDIDAIHNLKLGNKVNAFYIYNF
jgi:hypothetical protein